MESVHIRKHVAKLWLENPRCLLRLIIAHLCARARKFRARVLQDPPVSDAALLETLGNNNHNIIFFPALPKELSERAAPGSTAEEFQASVLRPTMNAVMRLRQYQFERNSIMCSSSAHSADLVALLIRLERKERETVQLALAVLYFANIIPAHWLPTTTQFCARVKLYHSLRSPEPCNLPDLNRRIVLALREYGRSDVDDI